MAGRMLFAIALSLACLGSAGCDFGTKEFICSVDTECPASNGNYGRCVNRHCAFHSATCTSGFAYDETAGDDANKCVPEADFVFDAAPPPPDAAPPTDAPPLSVDGGSAIDGGPPDV